MPLDPNAPQGMLQWIENSENTPEQEEVWRQNFLKVVFANADNEKQLSLPPEQRDPAWVDAQKHHIPHFDPKEEKEYQRRLRKGGSKKASSDSSGSSGGWLQKLFGG